MKTRNFDSLESFANALGQNVLRARIAEPLLDAIGETVSQRAAAKLGTYQGSSGPFDRWKQLTDRTQKLRVAEGYTPNDPLLRSGEMRDELEELGYETQVALLRVIIGSPFDKALANEIGTQHIPPRSFLGAALHESLDEIRAYVGAATVAGLTDARGRLPSIFRKKVRSL
jgi:hypothetical protein